MKRKAFYPPSFAFSCAALLLFSAGKIPAQNSAGAFPRAEPGPLALEYAEKKIGNGYSWEDLAEISLWASGAADGGRENSAGAGGNEYPDKIRDAAAELKADPALPAGSRERGEYILTYMHKKFLKSYSLNQTRLDTLLSNGRYNCVSSAALYLILARSAGLDVRGVMTRDHAFAILYAGGEAVDVETTNPYGFDPGNRREFHDGFGRLTGFVYVPAKNYRDRAGITPIELVSLILSNRISEYERQNRFAEAVPLAVDRAALLLGRDYADTGAAGAADSDAPFFEDPRRDMMNRIFNYGAFLLKSGREEDCLRWAALAGGRYPDEKRWQEFVLASANNRIQKLTRAGRVDEARDFLSANKAVLNSENYNQLDSALTDTELFSRASKTKNAGEADALLADIEAALGSLRLNAERAEELRTFVILKTAALLSAAPDRDWSAAINYINVAVTRYGSNPELEQALQNYRSNRAADFHNRFAAAFNKKNFEEAENILSEGLGEFPDDRRLADDKAALDRVRNRS
ncbi:MAG: hypothetical protein LBS57_04890 [Treponema sp.]|jgi:hypothetical protein|nr:hypothetical protein [Treponema sp.]